MVVKQNSPIFESTSDPEVLFTADLRSGSNTLNLDGHIPTWEWGDESVEP